MVTTEFGQDARYLFMRLIYTIHARSRMLERCISEADVEEVLANPMRIDSSRNSALVAIGKLGERRVKIIYRIEDNNTIIITVC